MIDAFHLVELGWIPWPIEPVEVWFVVGDPFLDGLPRWFDGLHGFDIEGWRRRSREGDDAFPKSVEAEEEFYVLAAEEGADGLHGPFAAGTLERVPTPDIQNEVAPEGAHVASGFFGWRWNEEDLDRPLRLGWCLGPR